MWWHLCWSWVAFLPVNFRPWQEWFTCQGFPGQWVLSQIFLAHPTFQLIFPRIHSHCAVFLEQAPSLSFWWTLSRTNCSFWASLTRSWHRCQMPSCSPGGKIWAPSPDSACAQTAPANRCSPWWAAFNEVIKRRSRSCWAEVPLHICCCFWASIDHIYYRCFLHNDLNAIIKLFPHSKELICSDW